MKKQQTSLRIITGRKGDYFTDGEAGLYRLDMAHNPVPYISVMTNNDYTPATFPEAWLRQKEAKS